MTQKERMLAGLPYKAWLDGLSEERTENKKRVYRYNHLPPEEWDRQEALLREILGKAGETVVIEPPFHCDYGYNIEVGENFFANYGLTILDVAKVRIGDNVWLGAGVIVLPGVTIGNNVVIGAGSVVNKDIPDNSLAVGNPCRVLRQITEADRDFYFKDRPFDVEDYLE